MFSVVTALGATSAASNASLPIEPARRLRRLVVVGTTGSGKSHLARRLGAVLDCPAVDLDDLNWLPGWKTRPTPEFLALVGEVANRERWVVAGNYAVTRPIVWPRAEAVVWLDPGFWRTLGRLVRRTVVRAWTRAPICNGNVESWRLLLSRDSILVWFFRTYWRNRRRYGELFAAPGEWQGRAFIRVTKSDDAERLLARLAATR